MIVNPFTELQKYGVRITAQTTFGAWGSKQNIVTETPVQIRGGVVDIGKIGAFSYFGEGKSHLQHIGSIGRFCAIGPQVVTGHTEHAVDALTPHPMFYWKFDATWEEANQLYEDQNFLSDLNKKKNALIKRTSLIEIGNDVWIGSGAYISRGVKIGDGAVIAARAVVVDDVPPYTVVGGVKAKPIRERFDEKTIEKLLELRWWEYGPGILKGIDLTDINRAIYNVEERISNGAKKYIPNKIEFNVSERTIYSISPDSESRDPIMTFS